MDGVDRYVIATTDAVSKQYNLLFVHSQSLKRESEAFLDTFAASEPSEDVQTYLQKARDSVKFCGESIENATKSTRNLDVLLGKVTQSLNLVSTKLVPVAMPDETALPENIETEMEAYILSKEENYSQLVDSTTKQKNKIASDFEVTMKATRGQF